MSEREDKLMQWRINWAEAAGYQSVYDAHDADALPTRERPVEMSIQ